MRKTKKFLMGILSAVFVCLLSFGVAACGGKKGNKSESNNSGSVSEAPGESGSGTEKPDDGDKEHSCLFGDWYETKKAKCEEDGEERRDCACGKYETRPISQTGHTYVDGTCACGSKYVSAGLLYTPSADNSYYTVAGMGSCTDEVVYIPETHEDKPVRTVGADAFKGQKISGVVLPDSVTKIESNAFEGCSSLVNVRLGNGLKEIGDKAFTLCINITVIVLPETLETIGNSAFEGCEKLEEIKVPDKVESLGANAFKGCSALENVQLGSGLTEIGDGAFTLCINITIIILGENVTVMGENVFDGCEKLLGVLFSTESAPDGWADNAVPEDILYAKGDWEYAGEEKTEVVFYGAWTEYTPAKCEEEGEERRYGVNDTEKYQSRPIKAKEHRYTNYVSNNDATCTEDGTKTAVCDNGCGKEDKIPDVGSAKNHSYTNYVSNNDATCTEDGTKTAVCDNGCGEKKTVADEGSAKGHSYTNYVSNNDATCTEDGTKTAVCDNGCSSTDILPDEGSMKEHDFVDGACSDCGELKESEGLKFELSADGQSYILAGIGTCTDVNVVIPNLYNGKPVTEVKSIAFRGNATIESIVFSENIVTINSTAFAMSKLKTVKNLHVSSIGVQAFYQCTALESIEISKELTEIGSNAFYNCSSLKNLYLEDIAAWCAVSFADAFSNPFSFAAGVSGRKLYVKDSLVTALRIPSMVTSISSFAFQYFDGLRSIYIPSSVTTIGVLCFRGCNGLTTVTIPNSVVSMGAECFASCKNLKNVTLGTGLTEIAAYTFMLCSNLQKITIKGILTSVGNLAFDQCTSLTSVYYAGSQSDWASISIGSNNSYLTKATKYYNS